MFIALAKRTQEYAEGETMEELLENAKDYIPDVLNHLDLVEYCDIHEIGKPLVVKAFVSFEVTKPAEKA